MSKSSFHECEKGQPRKRIPLKKRGNLHNKLRIATPNYLLKLLGDC
jgi:hypothetical protein